VSSSPQLFSFPFRNLGACFSIVCVFPMSVLVESNALCPRLWNNSISGACFLSPSKYFHLPLFVDQTVGVCVYSLTLSPPPSSIILFKSYQSHFRVPNLFSPPTVNPFSSSCSFFYVPHNWFPSYPATCAIREILLYFCPPLGPPSRDAFHLPSGCYGQESPCILHRLFRTQWQSIAN